jgi:hypothetical protein
MTGIIAQLLQSPVGVGLMVLMGLVMFTFLLWYGFFVIVLPSVSAISLVRDTIIRYQDKRARVGTTREERIAILNPQLGLTMADGGDSLDKEKKE